MKKLWHSLTAIAIAASMGITLAGCNNTGTSSDGGSTDGGATTTSGNAGGNDNGGANAAPSTDDVSITVWCAENLVELTTTQLNNYNTANGTNITFTVEPVGEGEAATNMITDVTAGADIFCFAQDQLARLVQAGALTAVSNSLTDKVTEANDAGAVAAASMDNTIYAFPLTSDNGYFMYYDKSVITDEAILKDQTALIQACKDAGKTICFELTDSVWYGASYFFATGCVSDWTTDTSGAFTGYVDTFNSANGLAAAKGMAELINSGVFVNSSSTASFDSGAAVVVTGTWDYATAVSALGDNLGCAELWSFTVDGNSYHLGSYSGNKLIGVKPQTDAVKAAYCQSVADFLTSEQCQQERFDSLAWGPSNKNVQASDGVQSNVALAALAAQNNSAKPQGQYPNAWWDTGKAIGASIQALGNAAPADADLQAILDTYTDGLNAIMNPGFTGWVVVGDMDVSWDTKGGEGAEDLPGTGKYCLSNNTYADASDSAPLKGIWEADVEVVGENGFRICLYNDWSGGDYHANGLGFSFLSADSDASCTEGNDNNIIVAAGTWHVVLDTTGDTPVVTVTAA